ncbi:MAG: hypothetical protein IT488_13800 [Gammaproteobacteria bacterium]|nr:hypothetical protein [Gammaproteobacteria bacterium]
MCYRRPISVREYAQLIGLTYLQLTAMCDEGRVFGAERDPRTNEWRLQAPVRFLRQDDSD